MANPRLRKMREKHHQHSFPCLHNTKTNIVGVNTYIHTYFLILPQFHNLKNDILPDVKEDFKNQNARSLVIV